MFERDVQLPDGRVMGRHEAVNISHSPMSGTTVTMRSYDGDRSHDRVLNKALDMTLTFEGAEDWAKTLPEFAEVQDGRAELIAEILPLLTDEQAEQVPDAFPEWAVGAAYRIGDRVRWEDVLYKCVQAHTSQEGWEPDITPALWTRTSTDPIPEWVQPTGSFDAYSIGDKVRHCGKAWVSQVDVNVWEPGAVGTEALWSEFA